MNNRKELQGLIIDLLNSGNTVEVPVYGISMFPFLKPGSIVKMKCVNLTNIKKGDIVFFSSGNKLLLHRVVRKGNNWIQCKGDSMLKLDRVVSDLSIPKVLSWQYNNINHDVSATSFKLYSFLMVYFYQITGWLLWPLAILWQKYHLKLKS